MQRNLEKIVENYFVDVLKMLYLCSRAAKIGCVGHSKIKNLRVLFCSAFACTIFAERNMVRLFEICKLCDCFFAIRVVLMLVCVE